MITFVVVATSSYFSYHYGRSKLKEEQKGKPSNDAWGLIVAVVILFGVCCGLENPGTAKQYDEPPIKTGYGF